MPIVSVSLGTNGKSCTSTDRNTRALAYLRIAVGVLFLIFAEYKVFGTQFTLGGGFQGWINRFIANGAYPFMVPVLKGLVLRYGTAIAFLVAYPGPDAPPWHYFGAALDHLVLALCFAAFAISAVGEVFTVEPSLRQLRRRSFSAIR